jgi:hypothetical protein
MTSTSTKSRSGDEDPRALSISHRSIQHGTQDPHLQLLVRPPARAPAPRHANARGLAFISKERAPRLAALGAILARGDYDIVCLQELWIYSEYEQLRQNIQGAYPFSRFFHT